MIPLVKTLTLISITIMRTSTCTVPGSTWYEYPILKGGTAYSGGDPGADRIVFNPSGTYCAVITHTGASDDDFLACKGD
ncbi:Ribonuclease/ribotoxin [Lentinula guzmanii]|uniref:Ribonuclease/ribotoxin n=1 Tax=Lentinula guzmanii TaxID=2804957 RepID=A0AA38N427_9AGAR|nr:Ribonuclease/ribotoxin [Lentinula guzmanii]